MFEDQSKRERIEEILTDAYGEYEQTCSWVVAFEEEVHTPFQATLLGGAGEVQGFQVGGNDALQCLGAAKDRKRWIGIEDLDPEGLPADAADMLGLYRAWLAGDY